MKILWLLIFAGVFIWSALSPKEYFTWFLEVVPAIIGVGVLLYTYTSFRLTTLVYTLILIHCIVLMVGGHYTYAEVPLFDYFQNVFHLQRNNFDKVGHFLQGFVPVLIAREIFIRKKIVKPGAWLNFLAICFCLAFSAFYEIVEWLVALTGSESAEAFLGTQGYVWDTQSDMGYALLGALASIALLRNFHNNQISKLLRCRLPRNELKVPSKSHSAS